MFSSRVVVSVPGDSPITGFVKWHVTLYGKTYSFPLDSYALYMLISNSLYRIIAFKPACFVEKVRPAHSSTYFIKTEKHCWADFYEGLWDETKSVCGLVVSLHQFEECSTGLYVLFNCQSITMVRIVVTRSLRKMKSATVGGLRSVMKWTGAVWPEMMRGEYPDVQLGWANSAGEIFVSLGWNLSVRIRPKSMIAYDRQKIRHTSRNWK